MGTTSILPTVCEARPTEPDEHITWGMRKLWKPRERQWKLIIVLRATVTVINGIKFHREKSTQGNSDEARHQAKRLITHLTALGWIKKCFYQANINDYGLQNVLF